MNNTELRMAEWLICFWPIKLRFTIAGTYPHILCISCYVPPPLLSLCKVITVCSLMLFPMPSFVYRGPRGPRYTLFWKCSALHFQNNQRWSVWLLKICSIKPALGIEGMMRRVDGCYLLTFVVLRSRITICNAFKAFHKCIKWHLKAPTFTVCFRWRRYPARRGQTANQGSYDGRNSTWMCRTIALDVETFRQASNVSV